MSNYGTVSAGKTVNTAVVQSANPEDLQRRVNAVIAKIAQPPGANLIASMTLAGAGDGHTFTVTIEWAPGGDFAEGGLTPGDGVACYMASQSEALLAARIAAGGSGPFADSQVAGASGGSRFMGMLVFGVIQGGAGGGGNVKTQQLIGNDTFQNVGIEGVALPVPINQAPSSPPGLFPDVVMDVTPGSKVYCNFVCSGYGTNSPNTFPAFQVHREDGAGNGFSNIPCILNARPPATAAFPNGDGGENLQVVMAVDYVAQEVQQSIRCLWSSGTPTVGGRWRGGFGRPFILRVEEIPA